MLKFVLSWAWRYGLDSTDSA